MHMIRIGSGVLLVLLSAIKFVSCRPDYVSRIPNGGNVKSQSGTSWLGVGHVNKDGGGARNQFGVDFQAANYRWTSDLCNKDSDCDGLSNGAELGDPNCVWYEGGPAPEGAPSSVTHPGQANNAGVSETQLDTCSDYDNYPYVQNPPPVDGSGKNRAFTIETKFPSDTPVPEQKTTYLKQVFDLRTLIAGAEGDSTKPHMGIKFEVDLSDVAVDHHLILYGCDNRYADFLNDHYGTPSEGESMPCSSIKYAWAVGGGPLCAPEGVGFRYDPNEPVMLLEVHLNWEEPRISPKVTSTGLRITLIQEDDDFFTFIPAGWLWAGVSLPEVQVPAKKPNWEITAECQYDIDPTGITVFGTINHGHLLSRKLWTEVQRDANRNGGELFDATCAMAYDFNNQELLPVHEEFKLYSDDVLITHCVYNSMAKTDVTKGGDATDEEMCINFMVYYPESPNELRCLQADSEKLTGGEQVHEHNCRLKGLEPWSESVCKVLNSSDMSLAASDWVVAHGALMIVAWALLIPIGAAFPRWLRRLYPNDDSTWFKRHRMVQSLGAGLVVAGFFLAYNNIGGNNHFLGTHQQIGLAVFSIMVAQVLLGICRPHAADDGEKPTKNRFYWELAHRNIGRILLCLALVNVILGILEVTSLYGIAAAIPMWAAFGGCSAIAAVVCYTLYRRAASRVPLESSRIYVDNPPS